MASSALRKWRTDRKVALDSVFNDALASASHVPGISADQANRLILLVLTGEFQAYCRDLHTEGVDAWIRWMKPEEQQLQLATTTLLTKNRKLDKGNPAPGSLNEDFNRFGMAWWDDLRAANPLTEKRRQDLERLFWLRNAVAHGNDAQLKDLGNEKKLHLSTNYLRQMRGKLNGLAGTMDRVLGDHLRSTFGRQRRPW